MPSQALRIDVKRVTMCRGAIAALKRDNAALSEELRLENKHSVAPTTVTGNHLLDQLQDECDVLTRKVGRSMLTARRGKRL